MSEMSLEQAETILAKGSIDHRKPTAEQREAKNVYFDQVIVPKYGGLDKVPAYLEPDWMEGWK